MNLILEFVCPLLINQHLKTHHIEWPHRQFGINPGPFFSVTLQDFARGEAEPSSIDWES